MDPLENQNKEYSQKVVVEKIPSSEDSDDPENSSSRFRRVHFHNTFPAPEKEVKRGVVGLSNLGNTCYMNSVLQAIRHIPEWVQLYTKGTLTSHENSEKPECVEVLRAFADLQQSLWAGSSPSHVYPRGFYQTLESVVKGTLYEQFVERTPQDAHEFLVWLLDQCYMASQYEVDFSIFPVAEQYPIVREAVEFWKHSFEKQYSPLTDLFFGLYRIRMECQRCHTTFTRWETFNSMKVTPIVNKTLYEAIEEELKDETIESYACEHCKAEPANRPNAVKKIRIWKLPKVLILTLKRFDYMGNRINHTVGLENSNTYNFTKYFDTESHEKSKEIPYHITSTIDHYGHSMGGHYSAQCFSPIYKEWYKYDDESVYKLDLPYVGPQNYLFVLRQGTYESQISKKEKTEKSEKSE
jgi:ubiquitin C-terminal hydrolase